MQMYDQQAPPDDPKAKYQLAKGVGYLGYSSRYGSYGPLKFENKIPANYKARIL